MPLCPSCGKNLSVEESSAKFCTYCGAPLEKKEAEPTNETPVVEEPAVAEETPVALLVLILVIVIAVSSSGSYMAPMKDYMKLVNKKNADYVKVSIALGPDFREKC